MEDVFGTFDDEAFAETRKAKAPPPPSTSYNAKICAPEWFLRDEAPEGDNADRVMINKYRGDRLYFARRYR